MTKPAHLPVLVNEAVKFLDLQPGGFYVDATVGLGGHTEEILNRDTTCQVLGIDRDHGALEYSRKRLHRFESRVHLVHDNFSAIRNCVSRLGRGSVNGILMDFGISSFQLDDPQRGFSFQEDGPLDMCMGINGGKSARVVLNSSTEKDLRYIFAKFGEIRQARRLAEAIVTRRKIKAFTTTFEFVDTIRSTLNLRPNRYASTLAQCFQAIRIEVNRELEHIETALVDAIDLLEAGGRLVAISFHSLEDRIVKNTFRYESESCVCPPSLPICKCDKTKRVTVLTKKPITPTKIECACNTRARSAKLRSVEKCCYTK